MKISLRNLKAISLCGCGLQDLDGVGVLVGLEELLLCDNFISDVTPLALHENLRVIIFLKMNIFKLMTNNKFTK